MAIFRALTCPSIAAFTLLVATDVRADGWTLWAEGLPGGVTPSIAISDQGEIFYALLAPQMDANGTIYRASLDDPARVFTAMPTYPLPELKQNTSYNNVMAMTTNGLGEPIVGLSINGNWVNQSPRAPAARARRRPAPAARRAAPG
ncbi:MAG TPA: hypothetical protein PKW35_22795, partial [Nannocystaceae bacterium]|nr:hypothetical protein [Nannocystaceae bacterium]